MGLSEISEDGSAQDNLGDAASSDLSVSRGTVGTQFLGNSGLCIALIEHKGDEDMIKSV